MQKRLRVFHVATQRKRQEKWTLQSHVRQYIKGQENFSVPGIAEKGKIKMHKEIKYYKAKHRRKLHKCRKGRRQSQVRQK